MYQKEIRLDHLIQLIGISYKLFDDYKSKQRKKEAEKEKAEKLRIAENVYRQHLLCVKEMLESDLASKQDCKLMRISAKTDYLSSIKIIYEI